MNTTTAADRMNDIIHSDGFRRSDDGKFILFQWGKQVVSYADALAAEESQPADFEECTGWVFGEGLEWADVVECEIDDPAADFTFGEHTYATA